MGEKGAGCDGPQSNSRSLVPAATWGTPGRLGHGSGKVREMLSKEFPSTAFPLLGGNCSFHACVGLTLVHGIKDHPRVHVC